MNDSTKTDVTFESKIYKNKLRKNVGEYDAINETTQRCHLNTLNICLSAKYTLEHKSLRLN